MDIRIGVIQTAKEIALELAPEADRADLKTRIEAALAGSAPVLWVTDRNGREVGVPAERIAYVELGGLDAERRVGFGA
ncbi:MAG: hypothetical protein QOJ19_93 [Acidimicrobiia bacterium]|jgi:hypothetical protein|nr:hypothetical protein [Acidimicrobiia bacterium]